MINRGSQILSLDDLNASQGPSDLGFYWPSIRGRKLSRVECRTHPQFRFKLEAAD